MEFYLKLYKIEIFDRPSIFFHNTGSLPRLLTPWTLLSAFWALRSIRVKIGQILRKIAVFAKISNFEKGPVLRSGLEKRVFGLRERSIPKNDGKHLNFTKKRKTAPYGHFGPIFEPGACWPFFSFQARAKTRKTRFWPKLRKYWQKFHLVFFFKKFIKFRVFWHPGHSWAISELWDQFVWKLGKNAIFGPKAPKSA